MGVCDSSNRETRAPNQENGNPYKAKEWRYKNVEKKLQLRGSKLNLSFLPGRHRGKGSAATNKTCSLLSALVAMALGLGKFMPSK
jgi:hypothetical protein